MRTSLAILFLLVGCPSFAVINPNEGLEQAKTDSDVVLEFKVTAVRHEQQRDVMFTHAEAEVLSVIRADSSIKVGDMVTISYGANYVREAWQAAKLEESREPGLGIDIQLRRLVEGQVATGWFNTGADGEHLVPAIGYQSFENKELPESLNAKLDDEVEIEHGQVVWYPEIGLELRITRFEWVSTCPPDVTCVIGGRSMPVFDVIRQGRHQEILAMESRVTKIPSAGVAIEVLKQDQKSMAAIRVIAIPMVP